MRIRGAASIKCGDLVVYGTGLESAIDHVGVHYGSCYMCHRDNAKRPLVYVFHRW
jgi:hypothetical protein